MRLIAIASAAFAAFGTTPAIAWMPNAAASVPESMWLAVWGFALIGISGTLRARFRPREVLVEKVETSASIPLQAALARRTA